MNIKTIIEKNESCFEKLLFNLFEQVKQITTY